MDQHNLSLMVALFIFLGTPLLLLYVWRTKHIPGLPRKAYPLCFMVCGGAFAAGFFLAGVIDSILYALAYAFQLDHETSAMAAKVAVTLMAALPASLAGLFGVKKIIRTAAIRAS